MIDPSPAIVEAVGKALHLHHGRGYCSAGVHDAATSYACWEEARVVLDAINGVGPASYPAPVLHPATLAARRQGELEQARAARDAERKRTG